MKKRAFGLMAAALVAMPVFVNAEEVNVTDVASLKTCVTKSENVCMLEKNIELSETINITNGVGIELNLNGYNITASANTVDPAFYINNGSLVVKGEGTITAPKDAFSLLGNIVPGGESVKAELEIGADVEVISNTSNCVYLKGKGAQLDVYGSLLSKSTEYAAVQGNGTLNDKNDSGNTIINVYEGASIINETDLGIYHPQSGTLTVNGGTIRGTTGIEMRSGNLVVKGGTITGTYVPTEAESNGNGSTTEGAGIAVAQHTTKQAIDVKISGGTIEGYTALNEETTESNITADDIKNVSITITGGTFNTINGGTDAIYSENNLVTVENGEFAGEVPEEIEISEGKEIYEVGCMDGSTKYIVGEESELQEGYLGLEINNDFIEDIYDEEVITLIETAATDKYNIASYWEIFYGDLLGESIVIDSIYTDILEDEVEVKISLPENLENVKEGFKREYVIIRIHENEDGEYETDILPATDNGDGYIKFKTDRFSTYVLAYEDTEEVKEEETPKEEPKEEETPKDEPKEEETPKVESKPNNPGTFDGIGLYITIGALSLISLVALSIYTKKAKNY